MRDVSGQILDSSRGIGMVRELGVGILGGSDGMAFVDLPPLDPSMLHRRTFSSLRVSGPMPGDGFPIGVGNDEWRWVGMMGGGRDGYAKIDARLRVQHYSR